MKSPVGLSSTTNPKPREKTIPLPACSGTPIGSKMQSFSSKSVYTTHNSSSIVYADFAPGALSAVDYDDPSVAGSLQLLHVGIATSVRDITSTVRLKNNTLHRRLEEGPDLKGSRERERRGERGGESKRERERERERGETMYNDIMATNSCGNQLS